MKYIAIAFSLVSSLFSLSVEDRAQIDQVIKNYTTAWNENGGRGFANDFSEDADFINIFGMNFSGRDQIEIRHVKILETFLKGSILEITNVDVREPVAGTAIALVHWSLVGAKSPEISKGVFSHVFIKKGDHWEIAACQNTLIRPQP